MSQQFVERHQIDDAMSFEITLLDEAGDPITTGVTIDVIKPDGTKVVDDQTATLIDALTGRWRFILPESDVDSLGLYEGRFKWTVGTTGRRERRIARGVYL